MNRRIAITGATGFVGASLVRHFARQGWEVDAYGRGAPPSALLYYAARYHPADVRQPMPAMAAGAVVHAAALASDHAAYADLHATNVQGTAHVWAAAREASAFVQISSSSVYPWMPGPIPESAPPAAAPSGYGRSKRAADQWLLEQAAQGPRLCILRPRAIYGIGDRVLLPRMLGLLPGSGWALLPGRLEVNSSMTQVGNLCQAVEACLLQPAAQGVYNIADAEPYCLREVVAALLGSVVHSPPAFVQLPEGLLKNWVALKDRLGIRRGLSAQALQYLTLPTVLNIDKAVAQLSFSPKLDFWNQLGPLADWIKKMGVQQVKKAPRDLPWME